MRLWHKDLIPVLPRQQLLSQWRECCCIAKSISEKGTPNHILVNRILDYPISHFLIYSSKIANEMLQRGYKCDEERFTKWLHIGFVGLTLNLFPNWHNDIYLRQCLYNLEEKYICGGIPDEEWQRICAKFPNYELCS